MGKLYKLLLMSLLNIASGDITSLEKEAIEINC